MKSLLKSVILIITLSLTTLSMLICVSSTQGIVISNTLRSGNNYSSVPDDMQYLITKMPENNSAGYTAAFSDSGAKLASNQLSYVAYTKESNPVKKVTVTASDGLNVRNGPGIKYKIIRILPLGTVVDVLEEKNRWYRIDDEGWINSYYTNTYQTGSKTAYLTFDDGPSTNNTPRILDILKKYKIKGTFFVNGYGKKDLYKRIANEGHVIGNHTYSHDYKTIYSSIENFKKDVKKLSDYLEQVTGTRPEILRFPGGSNNTVSRKYGGTKIMKKLCSIVYSDMGYQYFDWNVSSEDATTYRASKDFIIRSALKGARNTNRAIILMHDAAPKTTTADALPEIIEGLVDMGFKFDVLTKDTPAVQFEKP